MKARARQGVATVLRRAGYKLERTTPPDFEAELRDTIEAVRPYTMTSPERLAAAYDAVRHIERHGIEGDVVECGVWRGGSTMAMARTLLEGGSTDRHLHLFDTFAGMSEPTEADVSINGAPAMPRWQQRRQGSVNLWDYAPQTEVERAVASTGYPMDKVHLVAGRVEDTLPASAPDRIALLRLDTDWYESTRHELVHLWPRLASGGLLIIDDYGHWQGARRAVDEYLAGLEEPVFLARIDYTGRIAVKP